MNRDHGNSHFSTLHVSNNKEGYSGLELYRTTNGEKKLVANVIFWDACGQFFCETFNTDVPVEIIEELIAETKAVVKIR